MTNFKFAKMLLASKLKHFRALHERTGIPYRDMLFFDDESRNAEVEILGNYIVIPSIVSFVLMALSEGVTFMLASEGLTWKTFERGLSQWRKRKVDF